jgi:hypothetical protein
MAQLMKAFGMTPPPGDNNNNNNNNSQTPGTPAIGQLTPDGAYRWNGTSWVPNYQGGVPGETPGGTPSGTIPGTNAD